METKVPDGLRPRPHAGSSGSHSSHHRTCLRRNDVGGTTVYLLSVLSELHSETSTLW